MSDPSFELGFFKDDIIFTSPAMEGLGRVAMDDPKISSSKPLFSRSAFHFSPSSISFTKDYSLCYATGQREVWEDFSLDKIIILSIDQGNYSELSPLAFTKDSCRYLHPALASNDSLLVFSSDRLPSSGGLDLFVSRLDSTGWSVPENLGPSINTPGHERYPFVDGEYNLWFASTGHKGYGAYDLYVCLYNGKGWEPPQNLGPSINSSLDEIGFSVHDSGQVALYTRKSASGGLALKLSNQERAGFSISLVLLNQADPVPDPPEEVIPEPEPDPIVQPELPQAEEPMKSIQEKAPDPERLLFRVQILSNSKAGSKAHVVIDGKQYPTYEYHYKGSYRITVGEFETVKEANNFRLRCKQSGYNQAFVAAFRGNKRETDPSVFKE
jgi:hypothetical protein